MKKIILSLLVLTFAFSICACEKESEIVTPYLTLETIGELNAKGACNIKRIDSTNESFIYIFTADICEYNFTIDDVIYTIRSKSSNEDISGIYLTDFDGTLGQTVKEKDVKPTVNGEGYVWARWFDDTTQYFLSAVNVSKEDFTKVYNFMIED